MSLIRYQPINLFDNFNDDINRHLANIRSKPAANQERNWAPAVDIREQENRYLLSADIPGVDRENIEITLENGVLTLKGERAKKAQQADRNTAARSACRAPSCDNSPCPRQSIRKTSARR